MQAAHAEPVGQHAAFQIAVARRQYLKSAQTPFPKPRGIGRNHWGFQVTNAGFMCLWDDSDGFWVFAKPGDRFVMQ
jgi:hypothetical protein